MKHRDLEAIKENYQFLIEQFDGVRPPAAMDVTYCELLAETSIHHRRLGIAILLADAKLRVFNDHLRTSAGRRVTLLETAAPNPAPFAQWARQGLVGPFFDAWTAGADDLALRIAELSQVPLQTDFEYPEDHEYARWWYAVAAGGWKLGASLDQRLRALATVTDDDQDPRLNVCRALAARDQALFDEGLNELCHRHIEWFKERTADPAENATEGYVFIEGLALVRLARRLGIQTASEYPRVPGLVKLAS